MVFPGNVQFSGTLTLALNFQLTEGQTLTLFEYSSHVGQFDQIVIDATSGCTVQTSTNYGQNTFTIDIVAVTCTSEGVTMKVFAKLH